MSSNRFRQAINAYPKENVTDIKTAGITKSEEPIATDTEPAMTSKSENVDVATAKTAQTESSDYTNNYTKEKASDRVTGIELFDPQIQEADAVPSKSVKNGRKNVPNMFTQKNESKSIRKSLVLRPSSVKVAENYCAKNGGSFNELIQILLDNFIDEYGL